MQCDGCGKAPATQHVTQIVNNRVTELNLCAPCAEERGFMVAANPAGLAIADFLAQMVDEVTTTHEDKVGRVQCPGCGMYYSTFRETGHLGCAACYASFRQSLRPLLRRIHGEPRHLGKAPHRDGERFARRREMQRLHEELERAIGREDYERAAALRDSIRQLEQTSSPTPRAEGV